MEKKACTKSAHCKSPAAIEAPSQLLFYGVVTVLTGRSLASQQSVHKGFHEGLVDIGEGETEIVVLFGPKH
jgi:hypothetical protein